MNVYEKLADPVALGMFALTLCMPVLVGWWAGRRARSQSDFLIGGRAMKSLVVALSAVSSGRSSWLVLGVSGMAYAKGAGAIWAIVGYTTVEFFQFIYLGRRLRKESQNMNAMTLLDYLDGRFGAKSVALRAVGAAITVVFITAYVSAQLFAGAKTLNAAVGIDLGVSLVLSAAMILVYMVVGGFLAVAYNDVLRALVMLVGLVALPIAGMVSLGGPGSLFGILNALDPALLDPSALGIGALVGFLGIGLGSPGQPHILVRYMAIDDPAHLRRAAIIGTVWNVILGLGAVSVGLVGRALMPDPADLPSGDAETIYLVQASMQFGPLMYGLLVGGVFAAILSTADSQLLVVASTFVRDLYEKIWKAGIRIPESRRLAMSRAVVLACGAASVALAWYARDLVFWLVLFAWGGLGAAFGPAVILSLFWSRTTRTGVILGMVTGATVTVAWRLLLKPSTGIYELIPAFLASAAVIVAAGLLRRRPRGNTLDGRRRTPPNP